MSAKIKQKKRAALIMRDGDFCHWCKIELNDEIRTLDHVVPSSIGGSNKLDNLVLACSACNEKRGDVSYKKFRQRMHSAGKGIRRLVHFPFHDLDERLKDYND